MARRKTSRIPHPNPLVATAGPRLRQVPPEKWPTQPGVTPSGKQEIAEVWLSRSYLVQVFIENTGHERLTICRTDLASSGRWQEHIPWHVLQRLKAECGRGDQWAVECFPPDDQVVDVANMRHLFLLPEPPAYGWKKPAA